jgi:2-polyprenyl-3-methyl-5-hydroxy-6-metoxy-1,4-benzoquinol methylase
MANNALQRKLERMRTHGWFHTDARPGDRTLDQQLRGLGPMLEEVRGKTVLDVGCAEGLISIEAARHGATSVHGIEIVPGHIEMANQLKGDAPATFEVSDANFYQPTRRYDVVLLLAVLHKLKNPSASCVRLADAAADLCVVRLGPIDFEIISDARSNYVRQDIGGVMRGLGFQLERRELGPFDERTWYYRRGSRGAG